MIFTANTKEELKAMNLIEDEFYNIEFLNHDYFNGEKSLEKTKAKLTLDAKGNFQFLIQDDYGMDKFIQEVRVLL